MSKQILIETFLMPQQSKMIFENFNKNQRIVIKNMKIQQANKPNKNQRIYSRSILERETRQLIENCHKIGSRGIIGELDHPDASVVNLKNACLGVLDYRWKGNDMLGDVEILNTPNGKILREIYEAGYVPGISSRGMGSVSESIEEDGVVEVEDDFSLLCWDAVSDPSSHNAYFKEIREGKQLKESVQRKNTNSKVNQLMQEILCEIGNNQCCWK